MWFELLKKQIDELFKRKPETIYTYKPTETTDGKMSQKDVLELVEPIIATSNSSLESDESIVAADFLSLQKKQETGHKLWSVLLLYRKYKGMPIDDSDPKVFLYLSIDDETKEITEIYPR